MFPSVFEEGKWGDKPIGVDSWLLKEANIMYLGIPIDEYVGYAISAQLLWAAKFGLERVELIINSPGGHVTSCLAIVDVMNAISTRVETTVIGEAYSAAGIIAINGERGYRRATKNASIMLHDIRGGMGGTHGDMDIYVKQMERQRGQLLDIIETSSIGMTKSQIEQKFLTKDFYMTPTEAMDYGLLDGIVEAI